MTLYGRASARRPGLATLELALVLPVLAMVLALLLVVGQAGITRLQATLEARQNAWKQRHGASPGGRLAIRPSVQDLVRGEAAHTVKGPSVLAGVPLPTVRSHHAVLAGSLDFHDIPLDHPPELDFARTMAGTEGQGLDGLVAGLAGQLGQLDALQAQGRQQVDDAKQKLQEARQPLQQERQKLQAALARAQQKVQTLSQTVDRLNKKVADLEGQRKKALDIKDKDKRKQALQAIDQQLKAARSQDREDQKQLDAAEKELEKLRAAAEANNLHP